LFSQSRERSRNLRVGAKTQAREHRCLRLAERKCLAQVYRKRRVQHDRTTLTQIRERMLVGSFEVVVKVVGDLDCESPLSLLARDVKSPFEQPLPQ
jgi:hypothetical protein